MSYSCGEELLTSLIVTGVSSVWNFVNQKVVSQFPSFTVTISTPFIFVSIADFLCKQVEFWQQGFLNLEMFYVLKRPNFVWRTQFYRFRCCKLTQIRSI